MPLSRRPSRQTSLVLAALSARPLEWRHGYGLVQDTRLASGTLYPLLIRLSDAGLLEAEWRPSPEPGRPARHLYRLTASGRAVAAELAAAASSPETLPRAVPA